MKSLNHVSNKEVNVNNGLRYDQSGGGLDSKQHRSELKLSTSETHPDLPLKPFARPEFGKVVSTFQKLHDAGEEIGSAVAVYLHGRPVVDLWAGYRDLNRTLPWKAGTMVSTFSACKAMVSLCLLHLVDKGRAVLDDPVVAHWPDFARNNKQEKSKATLRHVLTHSVGLPIARTHRPGDVFHWERMVAGLEKAPLLWQPGTTHAYHAVTFGHLVGELVRRISGQMPSVYFAENIAAPLGLRYTLRFMPENAEETAECDGYTFKTRLITGVMSHVVPIFGGSWKAQYYRPCGSRYHPNTAIWRSAEAPAISGYGTPRSLARVYAMLGQGGELAGKRVFSKQMASQIAHTDGRPPVVDEQGMGLKARIGLGMFFNLGPIADLGPNPNSFGHTGMGGTTSFCDPDRQIGFAYSCNHLYQPTKKSPSIIGERAVRLMAALYDALG